MITKALVEMKVEPGDTEELLPIATESQSKFEDLYPLSVKKMREAQDKDEEMQKVVTDAIAKKERYQRFSYNEV